MRKIKVGLVQQSNTADTKANLYKLAQNIEDVCKRGAQLVVLQELHNSLYFCQTEDTSMFDLAETIPGLDEAAREFLLGMSAGMGVRDSSANWPGNSVSCWSRLYLNGEQPACTITRRWCSTPTAPSQEPTARCTSPTIRLIMKNSISPRATWASTRYRHRCAS